MGNRLTKMYYETSITMEERKIFTNLVVVRSKYIMNTTNRKVIRDLMFVQYSGMELATK